MLSSKRRLALVVILALLLSGGATLAAQGQDTSPQGQGTTTTVPPTKKVRVRVKWYRIRKKVPHYGAFYSRTATYYSTYDSRENPASCDSTGGGGSTSMGTRPRFGEVAVLPGDIPLGTWIWFTKPIHRGHYSSPEMRRTQGGRLFRVEDHIGAGSTLDIWLPCKWAGGWGNPTVHFWTVTWSHRWVQRYRWVTRVVPA